MGPARLTRDARNVLLLAADEARALKHTMVGTEHILLGLLREEHGLAARLLNSLEITLADVRGR
jgi:ATP-dependent Clp protease ATP-binding subunit ClpC